MNQIIPRITTIIANYNYGWNVCDSIISALKQIQNGTNSFLHKIVVIDDGSTDDSVQKIMSRFRFNSLYDTIICDPRIKGGNFPCKIYSSDNIDLICSKNLGASTARNLGMWHSWAETDLFCILDSDDILRANKYQIFLNKIMEHDEVGVVYGDYIIIRPHYNKYEYKRPYSVAGLQERCIIHSGSMIKKEYLERVLLPTGEIYDKNLHGPASKGFFGSSEDLDLWWRLSKITMFVHVPEALTLVHEHLSNQSYKMTPEIFAQNMETIKKRQVNE